jgi:hypothetical protein
MTKAQMAPKKARVLIACLPQAYARLFAILAGHELLYVGTLSAAQETLKGDRFDIIMIGVHFDESKMFDLLRYVRADESYGLAPVVCFRGIELEEAEGKTFETNCEAACKAVGASFFDLTAFPDDHLGNAAVRQLIYDLLLPPGA